MTRTLALDVFVELPTDEPETGGYAFLQPSDDERSILDLDGFEELVVDRAEANLLHGEYSHLIPDETNEALAFGEVEFDVDEDGVEILDFTPAPSRAQ